MEIRYFLFKVFNSYRVKFLYNDCNLFRIVFKIYKTCILYLFTNQREFEIIF